MENKSFAPSLKNSYDLSGAMRDELILSKRNNGE